MLANPLIARLKSPLPYLFSGLLHLAFFRGAYPHSTPSTIPIGIWVETIPGDLAYPHRRKRVRVSPPTKAAAEHTAPASDVAGQLGNTNQSTSETGPLGDRNGIQSNVKDRYLFELEAFLNQRKTYPARARHLGLSGRVEVAFHLHEDGSITDPHVVRPCMHDLLNRAAVELVASVGRFRPIPTEIRVPVWHISVPIQYEVN